MSGKILLLLFAGAFFGPTPVLAYIGPGAGLSAIGAALALIGAILLGIVGFLWYPIKRLMKRRKAAEARDKENTVKEDALKKKKTPEPTDQKQTGDQ